MKVRTWSTCTAVVAVLWGAASWSATLTWNPNSEPDLAGYRIYKCSQLPCGKASGTATLFATLGKVTSHDIGTPSVVQYYVVTAYDTADNESTESNVATFTPAGAPPPPPPSPPPAPQAAPLAPTGLRLVTQ